MSFFKRLLPFLLLTVFLIVPLAAVGVAGLTLLHGERERWAARTEAAEQRILLQNAAAFRTAAERLRDEIHQRLQGLPPDNPAEALRHLEATHPLVRNVFWIAPGGDVLLPALTLTLDPETRRFADRYAALFDGRTHWTLGGDTPERPHPLPPFYWRPWRWEDNDHLIAYLRRPGGDVVGIEVEMSALYARLDVALRLLADTHGPLLLLDRSDRELLASEEPPNRPPLTTEIGPLLPFARIAWHPAAPPAEDDSEALFMLAAGFGVMLLLSIAAAGVGLTAWLNRSRRLALQKTTFVSNVSHEFKTPLTTLRLYSELLLEGRVSDEARQKRYLSILRDESDRLARLVHNVLDFSRLELGRKPAKPEDVDLQHILREVLDPLRERIDALGIQLELPEGPLPACVDPDAASRILLNLIDNALKYAAAGKALILRAEAQGPHWALTVEDRGPGIPRRFRRKLFQPFTQADDTLTRESGGTGLGLHLSRRLARDNGGDLVLLNTPAGAAFQWTLPRNCS